MKIPKHCQHSEYLSGLFVGWIMIAAFVGVSFFAKLDQQTAVQAQKVDIALYSNCKPIQYKSANTAEYQCVDGSRIVRSIP